jgi:hypothetical protein
MKYVIFDDAAGVRTAVNPSQVVTVVMVDDRLTDVVLVGGAVVRVALTFESVVNQLSGVAPR